MVWRVAFGRSLKSHVLKSQKVRLEIFLLSEFDGEVQYSIEDYEIIVSLIEATTQKLFARFTSSKVKRENPRVAIFDTITPGVCGSYQYHVTISSRISVENFIIPLISSVFEIVDQLPTNWNILCKTYRPLKLTFTLNSDVTEEEILIIEDRGLTMGSHIWDSSLILFLNFQNLLQPHIDSFFTTKPNLLAVELGAGCSLLGIALAKYLQRISPAPAGSGDPTSHVSCTDLSSQVPLIRDNITLNHLDPQQISAGELDWSSSSNLHSFFASFPTSVPGSSSSLIPSSSSLAEPFPVIDVILAADVLYQSDMTSHFFRTLLSLSTPHHTLIFLAQKIRPNSPTSTSLDLVDLRSYEEYHTEILLHDEVADVVVWKLMRK
jgi:hypothetical protein